MTSRASPLVRSIAHRGLHAADRGVIENTASAFEAALEKSYGIECDLQPSADGEPMVFHDFSLDRLTRRTGPVSSLSARELGKVAMRATDDRILRLSELLELVRGRVPLLIEIKSDWAADSELPRRTAEVLAGYEGPYGVMSFDPRRSAAVRAVLPDAPVGIVAGGIRDDPQTPAWIKAWSAAEVLRNDILKPDFIAYFVRELPAAAPALATRPRDVPLFTWTVRTPADRSLAERYADAMIFESFEP
jgi:glycerophosphoryl diester phosphodiesterase